MIPLTLPSFSKQDEKALLTALRSTFASGDGPSCKEFEHQLSIYLGVKNVLYVTSCTAALDLAYMVKNFDLGKEVLVPNFTFTSTALAPILNGLKVVLVDVDPFNGNIDFEDAETKVNENTVAITPVDYAGNPVEIEKMQKFSTKHSLYVVHDAAQSFGSEYKKRKIGQFGDVTAFSFHGTKNLVTGEGGALVTNNDELAFKARIARDKGTDKYKYIDHRNKKGFYEYVSKGNSYAQSNILAELGISQLKKIDLLNRKREKISKIYNEAFSLISGIRTPKITSEAKPNWHIYYLLVPTEVKFNIIQSIRDKGVMANIHYNPLHHNQYYNQENKLKDENFPNSLKYFNSLIRIPMYPDLSEKDVDKIVNVVTSSIKEYL
tara:strand:- start:8641 stop:9774 length:1134 start_codon:yes stop_codon:yes gene_type:complete